jgi:hypothetical protein
MAIGKSSFLVLPFSRRIFALGSHDNKRLIDVLVIKVSILPTLMMSTHQARASFRVSNDSSLNCERSSSPLVLTRRSDLPPLGRSGFFFAAIHPVSNTIAWAIGEHFGEMF